MRNLPLAVVVVVLGLSGPVAWAVDEHHPEQKGAAGKPTASSAAATAGMGGAQMQKMQDTMLKMHEQMHKIMQAKDPKERERLKQDHMKMMQEHMSMMHGPGGMMGGMQGEGMMQRMLQMEKRMDTMQMQGPAGPGKK